VCKEEKINSNNNTNEIPIWKKELLSLNEATAYYGIGKNTIRQLTNSVAADCVLWIGRTRYIKRENFSKFLAGSSVI